MHSAVIDWLTHHKLLNWLLVSFSNTKPSLFYFQCKEKLWLPGSIIVDLWFTELPSSVSAGFCISKWKDKDIKTKAARFYIPNAQTYPLNFLWTFVGPPFLFFFLHRRLLLIPMEWQSPSAAVDIFSMQRQRPLHWRLMIGLIFWFPFFIFHTKAKPSNCLRNFSQSITSWRSVWPVVWLDSLYFGFTNSLTCSAKKIHFWCFLYGFILHVGITNSFNLDETHSTQAREKLVFLNCKC